MKPPVILFTALVAMALFSTLPTLGGLAGKVTREVIEEIIERTAKKSGVNLAEQALKKSAGDTLERLVKVYGEDVLKVVDDAGFELLEAIPKYGDDLVKFAMKASPQARRALALNVPELLPLTRRVGVEALELEARSPGLSVQVFKIFGDDTGKIVAKTVPPEDVPRLLKYGERADSSETRKLLLESYDKEGKGLFERIPPSLVLVSGLSASMLHGAHRITQPAVEVAKVIRDNPDVAQSVANQMVAWGVGVVLVVSILLLWRFNLMPWHRKISPFPSSNQQNGKEAIAAGQINQDQLR